MSNSFRRGTLLGGAALAVWLFAVGLSHSRLVPLHGDMAEFVNNPVRLLNGELPYRDFWLLHPPGEVLLPQAVYALGLGVDALLVVSLIVNVLVGLAAYFVVRSLHRPNAEALLAGALVFFAGIPGSCRSFVCPQPYFLCLLGAARFLIGFFQNQSQRSLFCAGLMIGLASLFKFYLAGAAAGALGIAVAIETRRRGADVCEIARLSRIVLAGVLVAPIATAICFAEAWPDLWQAVGVDSVRHATAVRPAYGYRIAELWSEATPDLKVLWHAPLGWTNGGLLRLSRFLLLVILHLLPFLIPVLYWYSRRKGLVPRGRTEGAILFFLLWGCLTFVRAFLRGGSLVPLLQAATPLYVVMILLTRPMLIHARETRSLASRVAAASLLTGFVGLLQWIAGLNAHAALSLHQPTYAAVAPYGTIRFAEQEQAASVQKLIDAVLENSAEGDYLFVTAWDAPPLYALTRRRNPTYYDSLIDLVHRPSEQRQRQVCEALLSRETGLVVHRPGWSVGSKTFEETCPLIDRCERQHFAPFQSAGPFSVLRRKWAEAHSAGASRGTDGAGGM